MYIVVNFFPEAEFLDVIGTIVLKVFLLPIHSHLPQWILLPSPLIKSWLKQFCNENIVYGNLESENSRLCPETSKKL
jgi:hypothetical protein